MILSNLTEIVFILDRSGSMHTLEMDTIGGFNSFIEAQKKEEGEAKLTTILFDDQYEVLHDGIDLKEVKELTSKDYYARGMTALLDAIGKTINTVKARVEKADSSSKSKVIFVITTDGRENASVEFKSYQIKEMVKRQTEEFDWKFIFLGANIDAISTAESFGISGQFAANWTANAVGAESLYMNMSKSIATYRSRGVINDNWKSEIK